MVRFAGDPRRRDAIIQYSQWNVVVVHPNTPT